MNGVTSVCHSPRANNHKDNEEGIIDPFSMNQGLFTIDFPSCLMKVSSRFDAQTRQQAEETIRILQLNEDDNFVQARCQIMLDYANGEVTLGS